MGKNNDLGIEGERLALEYLVEHGWQIEAQNYRSRKSEIDIIARKTNLLIFVEVKYRSNLAFGNPEDFVDQKKIDRIMQGANQFLEDHAWMGPIRFDIISIEGTKDLNIVHIEDAFA